MQRQLADKVAIVTGSGRGIGRAVAQLFAEAGAAVVVATRRAEFGNQVVAAIGEAGGRAALFQTELQSAEEVRRLVDFALSSFGSIDVMVHNAAFLNRLLPIEEMTDDVVNRTLALTCNASVWLTRECIAPMRSRGGGRLIFTSSGAARQVISGVSAYAMAKAGLNGWVRAAAYELGRYNITANTVEPGITRTEAVAKHKFTDKDLANICACIPLGRMGEPAEMAATMLFLASEGGAYITGQSIIVDGGMQLPQNGAITLMNR